MEFEKIFQVTAVVLVGLVAFFGLLGFYNNSYGTTAGTGDGAETYNDVMMLINTTLPSMSTTTANATTPVSGSGSGSASTDLITRAWGIITSVPTFLGLIPALFQDAAIIFVIPPIFVSIATWVFLFSFAMLFCYLLIAGIKRLT